MRFLINLQSFSDVITNSSSELFVAHVSGNTKPKDEIQKLINKHASEHMWKGDWKELQNMKFEERVKWNAYSGDAGTCEVKDGYDRYVEWINDYSRTKNKEEVMKDVPFEIYLKHFTNYKKEDLFFDIDHSFLATINYVLENFYVIEHWEYGCYEIEPGTKRILRLVSHEEWEKLPEERRSEY